MFGTPTNHYRIQVFPFDFFLLDFFFRITVPWEASFLGAKRDTCVRACLRLNRVADCARGGPIHGCGRGFEAAPSGGEWRCRRNGHGRPVQAQISDQGQEGVLHRRERAQLRARVREARSRAHCCHAHLGRLEGIGDQWDEWVNALTQISLPRCVENTVVVLRLKRLTYPFLLS